MSEATSNSDFGNLLLKAAIIGLSCLAVSASRAEQTDDWVRDFVVQFLCCGKPDPGGSGVYLGNGLVITAAHVGTGDSVRIDGLNVPARPIKTGSFPELDLSLVTLDQSKIPDSVRERRVTLCDQQPPPGAPVILAAPQGITRTSIASPTLIPPEYRSKFLTLISDGLTDGKSGSGVFDVEKKCLLGILSLKFVSNIEHKGIASYFVPADTIRSFIPVGAELTRLQAGVAPKLAEQSLPSLIVAPSSGIAFSGPQGGPFSPAHVEYRISASAGTVSYSIRTPSWLIASPTAGAADTEGVTITLTVSANASNLSPGAYGPSVAFTNTSNGRGTASRSATLVVQGSSVPGPPNKVESGEDKLAGQGALVPGQTNKVGSGEDKLAVQGALVPSQANKVGSGEDRLNDQGALVPGQTNKVESGSGRLVGQGTPLVPRQTNKVQSGDGGYLLDRRGAYLLDDHGSRLLGR